MKTTISILAVCLGLSTSLAWADSFTVQKEKNGVLMNNQKQQLRVEFINPAVVRIQYVPEGELKNNETNVCLPHKEVNVSFKFKEGDKTVRLVSEQLSVDIDKSTGAIRYLSKDGKTLLKENTLQPRITEKVAIEKTEFDESKNKTEKTANGDLIVSEIVSKKITGTAWKATQQFEWQDGEALYGLGSHQEDYMNLRGTMQYLYQQNLKASIPVLMSSKGYGLLFDAGSTMIFHDDSQGSFMEMNAVNEIDYYFMYGPEPDKVVSLFRGLTGKVGMMPKYIFGYVQSKERYPDQQSIDSIVTRFRAEKIPLDLIVQDWNYWNPKWWGHKKFREDAYPDPTAMIKGVHDKNAHFMLSLWPTANGNEATEMGAKGYTLGRGMYDAYNPAARKMYWDEYVNKNLFIHGVDAWWCDGSEPIDGDWNANANSIANNPQARYKLTSKVLNDLLGALRANTFSLYHSQGIYENQRSVTNEKRVVNLTRSTYAGQQRYGTFVWNGDTKATWADFAQQIPSGLNYMATGSPYWTIDAGAFFVKSQNQWFWKGDFEQGVEDLGYREFYVRNIQFCQWLPLFRSHGTDFPREPWQFGNHGEPFYESILKQINLRYRLLPYTYSIAAMVTREDYTMTRPLFFDFRKDSKVYDIKDQLMFGTAFMVCPVTKPMYYDVNSKKLTGIDKTRSVYLPKDANWIDFHTGTKYQGGSFITADAPIDYIPVFVRQGSIVPMGPIQQYSSEKPNAPYEIRIYPGADGEFTIYEDEGDNYNYEQGKYAIIALRWNDKKKTFTVGERKGEFAGMVKNREFNIVLVDKGKAVGEDASKIFDKAIHYDGKKTIVNL
ncbi:glycoside hydrolase family 31 protein [Viscerimonas tarda]